MNALPSKAGRNQHVVSGFDLRASRLSDDRDDDRIATHWDRDATDLKTLAKLCDAEKVPLHLLRLDTSARAGKERARSHTRSCPSLEPHPAILDACAQHAAQEAVPPKRRVVHCVLPGRILRE